MYSCTPAVWQLLLNEYVMLCYFLQQLHYIRLPEEFCTHVRCRRPEKRAVLGAVFIPGIFLGGGIPAPKKLAIPPKRLPNCVL